MKNRTPPLIFHSREMSSKCKTSLGCPSTFTKTEAYVAFCFVRGGGIVFAGRNTTGQGDVCAGIQGSICQS